MARRNSYSNAIPLDRLPPNQVVARGNVMLRIIFPVRTPFRGIPARSGNGFPGYKAVLAYADSPTAAEVMEWAYHAAKSHNRGTSHVIPETYHVMSYFDPYFGRDVKVIDVGMGS